MKAAEQNGSAETADCGVAQSDGYFVPGGNAAAEREDKSAKAADELKGQTPLAFAVVKNADLISTPERRAKLESEVMATVDTILGAIGRPCRVHFVLQLPKTRSGKVLRRSIKAIAEGHDPGDLTSLDDPLGIEQIERAVTVR